MTTPAESGIRAARAVVRDNRLEQEEHEIKSEIDFLSNRIWSQNLHIYKLNEWLQDEQLEDGETIVEIIALLKSANAKLEELETMLEDYERDLARVQGERQVIQIADSIYKTDDYVNDTNLTFSKKVVVNVVDKRDNERISELELMHLVNRVCSFGDVALNQLIEEGELIRIKGGDRFGFDTIALADSYDLQPKAMTALNQRINTRGDREQRGITTKAFAQLKTSRLPVEVLRNVTSEQLFKFKYIRANGQYMLRYVIDGHSYAFERTGACTFTPWCTVDVREIIEDANLQDAIAAVELYHETYHA